jgi:glycosyltransferase involved in cell wall biosynthesis
MTIHQEPTDQPQTPLTGLVSFITPTYNQEKYIGDCIRSALAQTYPNWEMIIIDDGSTDRTPQIIKSFSDKRIRYFRQDNLGGHRLGITYNRALKKSKGELLAILEGDDFIPPDKLAIQVPHFSDNDVILTYGESFLTDESGRPVFHIGLIDDESIRNNYPIGSALKGLVKYDFISTQTIMIRKTALDKIGGFIQHPCLPVVDYSTLFHLALEGKFKGVPALLGYFRRRDTSISSIALVHKRHEMIRLVSDFLEENTEQIKALGIDIKELYRIKNDYIAYGKRTITGHEAVLFLILGMHHIAKQRFFLYLKQRKKTVLLSAISLVGLLCAASKLDFTSLARVFRVGYRIYHQTIAPRVQNECAKRPHEQVYNNNVDK